MLKLRLVARKFLYAAAAFVAASAASAAGACSIAPDYVAPSHFELVQFADAIVVARAVGEVDDQKGVIFAVESAIKGNPPAEVALPYGRLQPPAPSDPSQPRTIYSDVGSCYPSIFEKGGRYLLFFGQTDGAKGELGFPQVVGDFDGENGPWVRTIRRYAKLHGLSWMDQLGALRKMVATRLDPDGAPLSDTDINDIRAHLGRLSRWKPTPFLLEALRQEERRGAPDAAPRPADAQDNALAEIVTEFVMEAPATSWPGPDARRLALLNALVAGNHPDAAPVFDRMMEAESPKHGELGLALRFLARNGQYARAFGWIETRLMAVLPALSAAEAEKLIGAVSTVQSGDEEGKEPWRTDPHAAAVWPELALSLYWHSDRFFGEATGDFSDAIAEIAVSDFRARPKLTLALADGHEPKVLDWAWAELNDEAKRAKAEREDPIGYRGSLSLDPAYLPLRILLIAWTDDREAKLEHVFCQGKARRRLLISLLGLHGGPLEEDFLARMAATPTLTKEERDLLAGAVIQFRAREAAGREEFHWDLAELTQALTEGRGAYEEKRARPITCPS